MQRFSTPEAISARPKRPERFTAEVNKAATQMSGMYGMQSAVSAAASFLPAEAKSKANAAPMPMSVNPTIHGSTLRRTKLRKPNEASLPSLTDLSASTGTMAAVSAPSPSRRRKRFGIWKAMTNAEPIAEAPKTAAVS